MAVATYDIRNLEGVGFQIPQSSRMVQIDKTIDFSLQNVDATEDAAFLTLPEGFVYLGSETFLLTAEGGTGTIDVGTEADPDGMLDGGNVNGTPNTLVAKAGTETQAIGSYLSGTEVRVKANNNLDTAKIKVVVRGYTVDDVSA